MERNEELMCFMFGSLISADNDELTEETKQEMISRYEEERKKEKIDWTRLMEPIYDDEKYKAREAKIEKLCRKNLINTYYETLQKT